MPPQIFAVCASSGAGKTYFANKLVDKLKEHKIRTKVLSMDRFYLDVPEHKRETACTDYNFDHPDAIDWTLLARTLGLIKLGQRSVDIPLYSFTHHRAIGQTAFEVSDVDVVILEGIFALHGNVIASYIDYSIYLDVPPELCLARRVLRDCEERGRSPKVSIGQYMKFTNPSFRMFIEPCKKKACRVIQWTDEDSIIPVFLLVEIRQWVNIALT